LTTEDFQGGSLWVGPPEIVPLEGLIQPEIVLQAPPMHMDFIPPVDASGADLLNLSFGLPTFNTNFTETTGSTTTTTHSSRTSNSFAEKESLDASISFGVPLIDNVSVSLKETAEQTEEGVVSKSSTTISSSVKSFAAQTDLERPDLHPASKKIQMSRVAPDESWRFLDATGPIAKIQEGSRLQLPEVYRRLGG